MTMPRAVKNKLLRVAYFMTSHIFRKSADISLDPALISFSFDDAPVSACETAAPILDRYGVRATFYIPGSLINAGPEELGKDQVLSLIARGHEVGCHTFSHLHTALTSPKRLQADITRNQEYFERQFSGYRLKNFSYPGGSIGWWHKPFLGRIYRSLRSTHPGINRGSVDLNALKAVRLYAREMQQSDVEDWIRKAVKENGWLIFYAHDIAQTPSRIGCTPSLFEFAVKTACQSQAKVVTIAEALDDITKRLSKRSKVF